MDGRGVLMAQPILRRRLDMIRTSDTMQERPVLFCVVAGFEFFR
jgi:hypothetical protein